MKRQSVMTQVYTAILCWLTLTAPSNPMFTKRSDELLKLLRYTDTNQMNYGVAVTDVDNDGEFEVMVAGFSGPNLVLKYDKVSRRVNNLAKHGTPYEELMDAEGQALGVCACDIDGDGREEIYVLNSNKAYAGLSGYGDKLFKWRNGRYVDLLSDPVNVNVSAKNYAGRSVACIDRHGSGKYGIIVATYALGSIGQFALLEMHELHPDNDVEEGVIAIRDVAAEARLDRSTGGRGVVVGPIVSPGGRLDVFFNNEGNPSLGNIGDNYLMRNIGNGTFVDEAVRLQLQDDGEAGRGVVLVDLNHDGLLDIAYGNYQGPNRIFLQTAAGGRNFTNVATPEFEVPCMVRTVLAADFDNDGCTEIFFNNINDYNTPQLNRLFTVRPNSAGVDVVELLAGDAVEEDGFGTGGAVLDLDQDGVVDLLLTHGEDFEQPVEIYSVVPRPTNNFLRVLVRTKYGGPARGATVKVFDLTKLQQVTVIDSGSGYLCQMEPVAHFGLGRGTVTAIQVQWPDGKVVNKDILASQINSQIVIDHPDRHSIISAKEALHNFNTNSSHVQNHTHTEL